LLLSSIDSSADQSLALDSPRDHLSHPSSAVMSDIMSSRESMEDEDGNVIPDGGVEETRTITEALIVQELEELVQQQQLDGSLLEFQDDSITAVPVIAPPPPAVSMHFPSSGTSAPSSSVPSPVASPSSSSSAICEPGTILFERGKSYALIGENRSGKSTLMQILCKLYHPSSTDCDIQLNGVSDFTALPRMLLRDRVSYVAQRPFIFPGTIEENIRIGNTQATAREVEQAAEWAGIFSMERPKSLAGSASQTRSLVERTGMAIVPKPWEQNRLKSVLLAAGGWLHRQWLRVHGFEAMPQDAPPDEEEEIEAAWQREEMEHMKKQIPDASSTVPATATSSSFAGAASHSIHPTLLLETAERGANLSGGFAQSVALARVFLRKEAQIIILDEAMGQVRVHGTG
jgi:ABC-type multidrug transport system fused ATPase/permease subunit